MDSDREVGPPDDENHDPPQDDDDGGWGGYVNKPQYAFAIPDSDPVGPDHIGDDRGADSATEYAGC